MLSIIIKGGLGNQIFQVLCALEYSNKTNNKLVIAKNLIDTNIHQKNDKDITILTLKMFFPSIVIVDYLDTTYFYKYNEKHNEAFKYNNIDIQEDNILLNGYFISEKYFPKEINYCLKETVNTINYSKLTNNFVNTYFIHIRLGDYVNNNLYNINLIEYYNYCINKIKLQDTLAKFIICTNEYGINLDNYINNFPNNNDYIIQENNNDAIDTLYIMSSCKGGICSNSTLSWLGSYFQKNKENNKEKNKEYIFMPYPWVNFIYDFNKDNIMDVYPEWVTIFDTINKNIK